jgi:hypothetical protein
MADGVYWLPAVVFVLAAFVFWARRKFLRSQGRLDGKGGAGFSIDGLERMLADGKISRQEYSALRQTLLEMETPGPISASSASSVPPGVTMEQQAGKEVSLRRGPSRSAHREELP